MIDTISYLRQHCNCSIFALHQVPPPLANWLFHGITINTISWLHLFSSSHGFDCKVFLPTNQPTIRHIIKINHEALSHQSPLVYVRHGHYFRSLCYPPWSQIHPYKNIYDPISLCQPLSTLGRSSYNLCPYQPSVAHRLIYAPTNSRLSTLGRSSYNICPYQLGRSSFNICPYQLAHSIINLCLLVMSYNLYFRCFNDEKILLLPSYIARYHINIIVINIIIIHTVFLLLLYPYLSMTMSRYNISQSNNSILVPTIRLRLATDLSCLLSSLSSVNQSIATIVIIRNPMQLHIFYIMGLSSSSLLFLLPSPVYTYVYATILFSMTWQLFI